MVSSNSYMMQLAMKEAGFKYSYGATLTMPTSIFKKLRNNFNEFGLGVRTGIDLDRKSTRLNSSHVSISYAVFCLKKKIAKRFNQSLVVVEEIMGCYTFVTIQGNYNMSKIST